MLIITEQKINELMEAAKKDFDVFDCREESNWRLPFKKYFFPPTEETLRVENKKGKISEIKEATPPKKFVLFGLRSKDLEALTQLDEIMKKPVEDFFYYQKRNRSIVIGITKKQLDSMPGGNIIFEMLTDDSSPTTAEKEINDNQPSAVSGQRTYKVWHDMDKGRHFVKMYKKFFDEIADNQISAHSKNDDANTVAVDGKPLAVSDKNEWSKEMEALLIDSELLHDAVEWSRTGAPQIWEELATRCLGCGVCTYVCPLCFCFSTEDKVALDGCRSRCRNWDACTLPRFSKIAGGFNFKKTIKERYFNWFFHKFVRNYEEYGKSKCVGCGRCRYFCPAKIDILEVLKNVLEEYKKNTTK